MKRLHPTLNFRRSDIASELIAPTGDEVVQNVMLHDRDSTDQLLAHCRRTIPIWRLQDLCFPSIGGGSIQMSKVLCGKPL